MPAVKGLIEKEGKVLLIQQEFNEKVWTLPGGRIEFGEGHKEALSRELKEEIDVDAEIYSPTGVYHFFYDNRNKQVVLTVFDCEIEGKPGLGNMAKEESIKQVKWVKKDSIKDLNLSEGVEEFFNEYYF